MAPCMPLWGGTATELHCLQLHTPQTKTFIPTHPQTLQNQTLVYGMRAVLPLSARRKSSCSRLPFSCFICQTTAKTLSFPHQTVFAKTSTIPIKVKVEQTHILRSQSLPDAHSEPVVIAAALILHSVPQIQMKG